MALTQSLGRYMAGIWQAYGRHAASLGIRNFAGLGKRRTHGGNADMTKLVKKGAMLACFAFSTYLLRIRRKDSFLRVMGGKPRHNGNPDCEDA